MTRIRLSQIESLKKSDARIISTEDYIALPFYKNDRKLESSPLWGMTLRHAGSMRFRWYEKNPVRERLLEKIRNESEMKEKPVISQVQIDHTKTVVTSVSAGSTRYNIADGIITQNRFLMPVITVADCAALYLYDSENGAFGTVHSGWKGTGIAGNAIKKMKEDFGSEPENICSALGAHIHTCCYVINQERAEYFRKNFGENCIQKMNEDEPDYQEKIKSWKNLNGPLYRLSLEKANLAVLEKCGIREENIVILDECTCCNEKFGSNRRETQEGKPFTVQAAFVRW